MDFAKLFHHLNEVNRIKKRFESTKIFLKLVLLLREMLYVFVPQTKKLMRKWIIPNASIHALYAHDVIYPCELCQSFQGQKRSQHFMNASAKQMMCHWMPETMKSDEFYCILPTSLYAQSVQIYSDLNCKGPNPCNIS